MNGTSGCAARASSRASVPPKPGPEVRDDRVPLRPVERGDHRLGRLDPLDGWIVTTLSKVPLDQRGIRLRVLHEQDAQLSHRRPAFQLPWVWRVPGAETDRQKDIGGSVPGLRGPCSNACPVKTKATGNKRGARKSKAARTEPAEIVPVAAAEPARASARPAAPDGRKSVPPAKSRPSVRPGARKSSRPPSDGGEAAAASLRWEERSDKDAYALDVLDRLVRYYAGRASASADPAVRAAAEALNAVSFALAAADTELLLSLGAAARQVVHGTPRR